MRIIKPFYPKLTQQRELDDTQRSLKETVDGVNYNSDEAERRLYMLETAKSSYLLTATAGMLNASGTTVYALPTSTSTGDNYFPLWLNPSQNAYRIKGIFASVVSLDYTANDDTNYLIFDIQWFASDGTNLGYAWGASTKTTPTGAAPFKFRDPKTLQNSTGLATDASYILTPHNPQAGVTDTNVNSRDCTIWNGYDRFVLKVTKVGSGNRGVFFIGMSMCLESI